MDAITLLKNDHRTVEKLFKAFESAGERAHKTKGRLVRAMITDLSIHATIEEQVLYPVVRVEVPDAVDDVLESLEEHHVMKWLLSELDAMDATAERFDAKATVLIENVRHHVKEEERDLFPRARGALGRKRLAELGSELEVAKRTAPIRPHPEAPDTPAGHPGAVPAMVRRAMRGVPVLDRLSAS